MPKVVPQGPVQAEDIAHPVLGGGLGPYAYQLISDPGLLTQFGAFIEHLPPGSRSSFRHWHQSEDEMIYVLSGEVVLVEDTETPLHAGEAACWPAGSPVGHCLENRSDDVARYLVVGTRTRVDRVHYPDHDLITEKDGPARRYLHGDGRPRGDTP
ncbi:MAG: cupin domain-containing protein [Gemmobacter sp.]